MNLNNENVVDIVENLNVELYEKYGISDLNYFIYSTNGSEEKITVFGFTIWFSEEDNRVVINEDAIGSEPYYEDLETYLRREYNNLLRRLACRKLDETI